MKHANTDITALLRNSRRDEQARDGAYRLIYHDLRRIAGHRVAVSRPGETLSVTSLVNEAYLKLTEGTGARWADRAHFFRVAAQAMRQITVDYARARLASKRGGGQSPIALDEADVAAARKPELVLELEEGLARLAESEPRLVQVVECRFYAGLSNQETAEALEISRSTVDRDWAQAREWLADFIAEQ